MEVHTQKRDGDVTQKDRLLEANRREKKEGQNTQEKKARKRGGRRRETEGERERMEKRCKRKTSGRTERQRTGARTGAGVGWGGEQIEALEAGELRASPGPGFSDFPNAREIQGSLCGLRLFAPDPDLVMPLIWFLNSGLAAFWAGAGVC